MQEPPNGLERGIIHSNSVTHTTDLALRLSVGTCRRFSRASKGAGEGLWGRGLPAPASPTPPPAEHLFELGPVEHGPDADADVRKGEDRRQHVAPDTVFPVERQQGWQKADGQVGEDGRHDDQQDVLQGTPLLRQGAGVGGALLPQRPGQTHQAVEHDHEEDADEHGHGQCDVFEPRIDCGNRDWKGSENNDRNLPKCHI